jgi:hypothetical protein
MLSGCFFILSPKFCYYIYITLFKYRVSPHIRNQSIVKIVKFQYTLVLLIFPSFIFQYASVYKKEVYIT